ncbi:MAG TPA: PaaI family thioesterase, partial [Acidimicrobiales bacterium]|nr:PaaI family thioesterase [Acidimicrobiales bacterium]
MNSLTGTEIRGPGHGLGGATGVAPTGYDQLAAIRERGPSAVGVAGLLDRETDALPVGHVVFPAETRPAFGNPLGTLHGGITATLLDSAMTCAVMSALPAGV